MIKLLALPLRQSKLVLVAALLASVASGISTATLIALIGRQLAGNGQGTSFIPFFGLLVFLTIALDMTAKSLLTRLTNEIGHALRLQLAQQLLETPLARLERLGTSRITTAFTEDTGRISQAIASLPALSVAVTTTAGCLLYLAWLSPSAFGLLVLLSVPLWIGSRFLRQRAKRFGREAQTTRDRLFRHLLALTEGIKELQLHRPRQQEFMSELLEPTAMAVRDQREAAHFWHNLSTAWTQSIYFLFILAILAFVGRAMVLSEVLAGYALVVLYLRGSLWQLAAAAPQWAEATLALHHLEAAGFTFTLDAVRSPTPLPSNEPFVDVTMQDVVYQYRSDDPVSTDARDFTLGPLTLTLRAGEVVFIVGGNGSGKTTMLKLLAGLYEPEGGHLRWNGTVVNAANRDQFRQNVTAIFADPYVFSHLLGLRTEQVDERAREYLTRLRLAHRVSITNGELSTTDLSHGQRKRLALVTAYLEDRPVYLFDEWAASQDPGFRSVFYQQLVPELKARGKLVVVITHDDQYFDVADRLIKLDFGQIVADHHTAVVT